MFARVLVMVSGSLLALEIVVVLLGHYRMLGQGETAFIRFVQTGGGAALLAAVTAVVAVTACLCHRMSLIGVIGTVVFAALCVALFLGVIAWGC
ncbi:MAG: hypothetical protein ABFC96_08590 [Thermoguttaceae bacterium]